MNTKLTLTIDQTVIENAKSYSRRKGRSLSNVVENYLKALSKENRDSKIEISPEIKSLRGSCSLPENFDYKKELTNRLSEKYL